MLVDGLMQLRQTLYTYDFQATPLSTTMKVVQAMRAWRFPVNGFQ